MNNIMETRISAYAGSMVGYVIEEMVELSKITNSKILCNFNGCELVAYENNTYDDVKSQYVAFINRNN
jgi:hypothetical protein